MSQLLSKKALQKLARELPVGSAQKIRERIIAKSDLTFSPQYIRAVLDPDDPRKNIIIIEAAVEYRDELQARKDDLEGRIFNS